MADTGFQPNLLKNRVALITGGGTCRGIASDAASCVNGVTVVVDGSLCLRAARIMGEE